MLCAAGGQIGNAYRYCFDGQSQDRRMRFKSLS